MVRESASKRSWNVRPAAPMDALSFLDAPLVIAQVLYNRGITTRTEMDSFLNPSLHHPALLPDMEAACNRLKQAFLSNETVGIFGDFDVDGVTGTALAAQALGDLGMTVVPYLPDRITEGHGLNAAAVQALREQGVTVLITVDCGITSLSEVSLAQELGMDVIITDHHVPPPELPTALAIIDPKLEDSDYPFPDLSGAGLAFKLVQGIYESLGKSWNQNLLELAALSTVADLVALKDENRFLVKEGLKALRGTQRPGLLALYERARLNAKSIDAETISFMIAPRLNAAGRLEHASASYGILLTNSSTEGERLASRLEALNKERQQLTEEAHVRARDVVLSEESLPSILLVVDDQLSPGIAGLVASRLVEEFYRPAIVMAVMDDTIRASARSIPEFDLTVVLSRCGDLFIRYGGHPQAAGFEARHENLSSLKQRLSRAAGEMLEDVGVRSGLDIDAEVSLSSLKGDAFRWLKELEPFGPGNPTPTFLTRNLKLVEARQIGGKGQHLKLKLKEDKVIWNAMAFRQADRWVPDTQLLDVVYTIGTDSWGGTEVRALKVIDFCPSAD